jgi:hypothetical protein
MVLVKAPIRSRSSDRLVLVPGTELGRQLNSKARGRSHTWGQAQSRTRGPFQYESHTPLLELAP